METLITKNVKSEMDLAINKIADGLEELFCIMNENKIDIDRIYFMKHIATVIDSGLNISHFHLSGNLKPTKIGSKNALKFVKMKL